MDPLTLAAIAVATTMMTKALEKIGENVGDKVFSQSEKFISLLRQKSPQTAVAIERAEEEPLNYGQAVFEVDALAKQDLEFASVLQELAAAVEEEPNFKLSAAMQQILEALKSQPASVQNMSMLAEKIGFLNQGVIQNQTNTFNI